MNEHGFDLLIDDLSLMENDLGYLGIVAELNVLAQDATFGNAQPVSEQVESLMRDGDLSTTTRDGNRTQTFLVEITAPDQAAQADAEAVLMGYLDRPATLSWVTPYGPTSCFDVVRSWSEFRFDDFEEAIGEQRGKIKRVFAVTFEALPYARSVDPVVIAWTGPGSEIHPLDTLDGWTVVSGPAPIPQIDFMTGQPFFESNGDGTAMVFRTSSPVPVQRYLWIRSTPGTPTTVGGVEVTEWVVHNVGFSSYSVGVIPESVQMTDAVIEITWPNTFVTRIRELWTTLYPPLGEVDGTTVPHGIGAIEVVGSARAPVLIEFSVPSGGAFVYTAPDPDAALAAGAAERILGYFTVSDAAGAELQIGTGRLAWFPQGTHVEGVGETPPRPREITSGRLWPTQASGRATWDGGSIAGGAVQWAYPADDRAAVSVYTAIEAVQILSPSPEVPEGIFGGAVMHEEHVLHPGVSGFAVLDKDGKPIPATITYYPRWRHHAAQ